MPALILHFFDKDDPNGDTIFECSTDDEFVKQVQLKIERDSMGGGTVNFARKTGTGLISRNIVVPETLVRVVIPEIDSDKYLWGFFINPRQQQVVSKAEKGGEGFTFGGPGPKHYLSRAVLRAQSFTGVQDAVDDVGGVWVWPETASAGRILSRLISEDAAATAPTTMLPDLTKTFNLTQDSDSVAWTDDISSNQDFTLNIGDDFLKLMWILEDASGMITHIDLGSIGSPTLQLEAWQTKGRDLTGDLAADTVHFIEGVNIAADLNVEGQSFKKASHALVIGNDGQYTIAQRPGYSAGELKRTITTTYPSANDDVLERAGQRFLNRQENGERQINLKIVPGWDPENGLYMFGPPGTDGHFWLWDTVDLTTGQATPTVLDYLAESQAVTGIHVELEKAVRDDDALAAARSFDVKVILNHERQSSNTTQDLAGNRGSVQAPPAHVRLCRATVPPGPDTPGSTVLTLTWNFTSGNLDNGTSTYDLMASRQLDPGTLTGWWGFNGGASTNPEIAPRIPITAGQSIRIVGSFSKQLASTLQTSHIDVNFYAGAVGGAILQNVVVGIPASGAGLGVVASVDESVVAPASTNYATIAPYRNLYGDNITVTVVNAGTPGSGEIPGAGLEELVGTGSRAARCDHQHHVFRETAPTVTDDDEHGYPTGTAWIVVDDEDNPTQVFQQYLSLDDTDGAALWVIDTAGTGDQVSYDNTNTDFPSEPDTLQQAIEAAYFLRWEAVTNGEDVFVWEDDDLVHEWKDYA